MLNRIRENKPEFLLAVIILIIFGTYSFQALSELYPQILSNNNFKISDIKEKNTAYSLRDTDNTCVGTIQNSFNTEDQNIEYSVKTLLNVSADDKADILQINLQSAFNPLNQMVASVLSAKGLESEIIIGLLNVNPVELSISYNKNRQTLFKKKFSLPGPFMLQKVNNQLLVQHQPTGKSIPLDFSSSLFALLNLKVLPDSPEKPGCPNDNTGRLDLSLLSRQLESKLQATDLGAEIAGMIKMPLQ